MENQRPKLEFKEVNKPMKLTLLFNEPILGESRYGNFYLYAVRNGDGSEYSYFATEDVHEKIKDLKAGDSFEITKVALHSKAKNKVITAFDVKLLNNGHKSKEVATTSEYNSDYFSAMEKSIEEALRLQNKYNGISLSQIAITLFIQRTRGNHSYSN